MDAMRAGALVVLAATLAGCTQPQETNDQRVRRQAADDAREVRKDLRDAGKEAKQAAEQFRTETKAAIAGAREGWKQGAPAAAKADRVDLNTASPAALEALPGVTASTAHRIVRGRPYDDPEDLLKRHIVSESEYDQLKDRVR